ncbi:MAG: UPF0182 family protein [Clostridia bacterium]|nr:UPF0182 family protein [Clostridia bacterium]
MKLVELLRKKQTKTIIVLAFLLMFVLGNIISLRGGYLEYKELGENYIGNFYTNLKCKYITMGVTFVILFIIIFFTNRGIRKGLKPFEEQDKVQVPKLPNKSIALIISLIVSVIFSKIIQQQLLMFITSITQNISFGIADPLFNIDISYFMFVKPFVEKMLKCLLYLIIGLSIYMTGYYIVIFNTYFNGIDRKLLKQSMLFKKLIRNFLLAATVFSISTLVGTQSIVLKPFLTVGNTIQTELTGAGFVEATIKLFGDVIFSILIIIVAIIAVKYFKKEQSRKVLAALATIPLYYVAFFIVIVIFDLVYVNSNELDNEGKYITKNIEFTKNAYDINAVEENLEFTGTITLEEVQNNENIINNIPLVSEEMVLNTLRENQTENGYYTFRTTNLAKYKIGDSEKLVYVSPREIISDKATYNYKTYEYTHGIGELIVSATNTTEAGGISYLQKDIEGKDDVLNIVQPRIYFGMETNDTIVTNSNKKTEYDYTDENGKQYGYEYTGEAGLKLNFLDRLTLAIKKRNIKLALSSSVQNESKILINRNIRERAKTALPYLMYDENPYTVIDENGNICWVLDAYTVSSDYPYSTYSEIIYEGNKIKINYIRNSVKVIINAYDGTMKFYITDRTDPIAMTYNKLYPDLFEAREEQIPDYIAKQLIYPKYLYDVQAKMLEVYHNVKPEVLYRANDIWQFATYNTTQTNKTVGTELSSYYTILKSEAEETLGLVQMYTKEQKSNIISYLVGEMQNGQKKLTIYKFSSDSNILGPTQLDKQIEQDETISKEMQTLNITGSKITKKIIIVPIENTILYVEPIYQTMINESDIPSLKKIIVASGTKMAIGDTLEEALQNLLSQYAVNIQINSSDDVESVIQSLIKANKNLKESSNSSNWEMMGSDIQEMQELIDLLEKLTDEQDKNRQDIETNNQETKNNIEQKTNN